MPRKKNEGKKLYTATYWFEGKRYYVRSSVSQRDADKRAAKALQEREDGTAVIKDDIRVTDYALQWAKTYKSTTVSETVYKSYVARINNHIIPAIGSLRVRDVRPTNLQDIMNSQAGMSKTHCDKLIVTIKSIFRQAVKDSIIRRNPSEDVSSPMASDGTHRSITDVERASLLRVASSHRFGLAVKIMLYVGLRPQEAVALKWSDIDRVNQRVMVRKALKKDGTIGDPKSESGNRDIPIPPALWESLHFPDNLDEYILLNTHGTRYAHTAIKRAWDSFRFDMDIDLGAEVQKDDFGNTVYAKRKPVVVKHAIAQDLELYCLRHTYCTDLEAAGVPINVAKYLMGHSSITLTAKIYTHMREDTLSDAADKIAKIGATVGATVEGTKGVKTVQKFDETDYSENIKMATI